MTNESMGGPNAKLLTVVKFMWLVLAVAALFVGWIFFSRWQEARQIQQRALEKKRAEDQRTFDQMGGNRFEIRSFYGPAFIRRGETAQLCYGVSNAKKVRLTPQSNAVWPSLNRCVNVSPAKDTTYTLTIEDAQGNTKSASLTLQVR